MSQEADEGVGHVMGENSDYQQVVRSEEDEDEDEIHQQKEININLK